MDPFDDDGGQGSHHTGHAFNPTGDDFIPGYGDGSQASQFSGQGFNSGFADGGQPRDFLSLGSMLGATSSRGQFSPPVFGYPSFGSAQFGASTSSTPTPSQLGLDLLDLNANAAQAWGDMPVYQGILQSGDEDGVGGSNRAPPPVRVPSRGGRGTTWLRGPRNGGGGGGRFPQRGAASASAGCSRGRAARRRLDHSADNVPDDKVDRAAWSEQNTLIFCQIYCETMDMGLCNRGQMTKMGWEKITEDYFKATKLLHGNRTFGSKILALKTLWLDIQKLYSSATGLGQEADGNINATDEWWAEKSKEKRSC